MELEEALKKIEEYESTTNDLQSQLDALKKNNESLVSEKRSVLDQKRALEEEAKQKAAELAKTSGNYESLAKQYEAEKTAAMEKLSALEQRVAEKEIGSIASKLAHEIAYDSDAATLLEEQFAKRLKYEDDGVKIIDQKGGVTVSTPEDLKKEFLETPRFKALLKGNPATGGRPIDANGSPVDTSSKDFDKLSPVERINRARGIKS